MLMIPMTVGRMITRTGSTKLEEVYEGLVAPSDIPVRSTTKHIQAPRVVPCFVSSGHLFAVDQRRARTRPACRSRHSPHSSVRTPRPARPQVCLAPPAMRRGRSRTTAWRCGGSQACSRGCVAGATCHWRLDSKGYYSAEWTLPAAEVWRGLGADSFKGALPNAAHS